MSNIFSKANKKKNSSFDKPQKQLSVDDLKKYNEAIIKNLADINTTLKNNDKEKKNKARTKLFQNNSVILSLKKISNGFSYFYDSFGSILKTLKNNPIVNTAQAIGKSPLATSLTLPLAGALLGGVTTLLNKTSLGNTVKGWLEKFQDSIFSPTKNVLSGSKYSQLTKLVESKGDYGSVSPEKEAFGAYQFTVDSSKGEKRGLYELVQQAKKDNSKFYEELNRDYSNKDYDSLAKFFKNNSKDKEFKDLQDKTFENVYSSKVLNALDSRKDLKVSENAKQILVAEAVHGGAGNITDYINKLPEGSKLDTDKVMNDLNNIITTQGKTPNRPNEEIMYLADIAKATKATAEGINSKENTGLNDLSPIATGSDESMVEKAAINGTNVIVRTVAKYLADFAADEVYSLLDKNSNGVPTGFDYSNEPLPVKAQYAKKYPDKENIAINRFVDNLGDFFEKTVSSPDSRVSKLSYSTHVKNAKESDFTVDKNSATKKSSDMTNLQSTSSKTSAVSSSANPITSSDAYLHQVDPVIFKKNLGVQ